MDFAEKNNDTVRGEEIQLSLRLIENDELIAFFDAQNGKRYSPQ